MLNETFSVIFKHCEFKIPIIFKYKLFSGMINNYQRDADTEDDRDSGSISILSSLQAGDQVWVEWRGYGESFLYSNPYRLISFTGFLLTADK